MSKNDKHEKRLPNGMRVTSREPIEGEDLMALFDVSDVGAVIPIDVHARAAESYRVGAEELGKVASGGG